MEFGDYVKIEQRRYGVENEMYLYKVVGPLCSNSWVEVPVKTGDGEVLHDKTEPVIRAICCGVLETRVEKFRQADVVPTSDTSF